MRIRLWLLLVIGASSAVPVGANDVEEFFDAARQGDLAGLRRLVQGGIDVDVKSRYGSTALHFASDKGRLEAVRYLLESGADVNARDTFYGSTPLAWALMNGHVPVAVLLLKSGAADVAEALRMGIARRNVELIEAVLAGDQAKPDSLRKALRQARQSKAENIVALLEKVDLPPEEPKKAVVVSQDTLRRYQGHYRNITRGVTAQLKLENGRLRALLDGRSLGSIRALSQTEFQVPDAPGVSFSLVGRGGLVERLIVRRNQDTFVLTPYDPKDAVASPQAPAADVETPTPPEVTVPGRKAPLHWPSFRGRNASGVADGQGAPLNWDAAKKSNVRWKTPVAGLGNSSPVIWGDRIFITTTVSASGNDTIRTGLYGDVSSVEDTSQHTWKVICLNARDGSIRWERTAAHGRPLDKRHLKSTLANPTPALAEDSVVALFPSHGLFRYDWEGHLIWKVDLGRMDSGWFYDKSYEWGFSSSPVIHEGVVILQVDVQDQSYIAAYRLKDGQRLWKTLREEIPTWSTPTIFESGGKTQVVANGTTIRSYDFESGVELWRLKPNSEIIVGTPVTGHGLVYLTAGYPPVRPIYAVNPTASGDISLPKGQDASSAISWRHNRGGTYIPTPIVYRGRLYTLANDGRLTCYDALTGKRIYRARVGSGGSFSASPIAADGRLYFTSEDGQTIVAAAGDAYRELARNNVGESVMATPAVSDGLLIVRGVRHVFGIGAPRPR